MLYLKTVNAAEILISLSDREEQENLTDDMFNMIFNV